MDTTSALNALPGPLSDAIVRASAGGGVAGALLSRLTTRYCPEDVPALPHSAAAVRVAIGPANEVAQAHAWASALRRDERISATSFAVKEPTGEPVDVAVPRGVSLRDRSWTRAFSSFLRSQTHVINESARPMLGRFKDADAFAELEWLRNADVATALMFHGSDIRDPDAHLRIEKWSPFDDPQIPTRLLRRRTAQVRTRALRSGMPLFVTTPDLLRDLPDAAWCPVVIDCARWRSARRPDNRVPVVVHAPSRAPMKGTSLISRQLQELDRAGVLQYREVTGVPADLMPAVYGDADIVLDQFRIGAYGAAACEAMASGCVVVGHVAADVRAHVKNATQLDVPIVEATPDTITSVLRRLVSAPDERSTLIDQGSRFVTTVHSGDYSARVLSTFIGIRAR